MIKEFLAFRYKGVRRIDEILEKTTDTGWKCRKYIKWREVHNSKADAKALYSFAENLIEKEELTTSLYGQISGVFLNVQKWKLDKVKMAVDPPARKEWERCAILFRASQKNPSLIPARLSRQKLAIDGLTGLAAQILFYASELDTFLRTQRINPYPSEHLSKTLLNTKQADWGTILCSRFGLPYKSVGLHAPELLDLSELIRKVLSDLGFTGIELVQDLSIPTQPECRKQDVFIELVVLGKYKLLEVAFVCGIIRVRLNKNHPYIESILTNGALTLNMEMLFASYARCMLRMGGSMDTLETFNEYLGLDLHTTSLWESVP